MKKWTTAPAFSGGGIEVKREFGDFLGELLLRRGIADVDSARDFFFCDSLSDPAAMLDMEKAADIIRTALDEGKQITVFGDYDCDGVTATVILYSYLEAMGAAVDFYIPDRSEGYGMNIPAVKRIIDGGTELIITVDNGISAVEEAEYIRSRGVQLVITDHHQPPETLPVCDACVDPHRVGDPSVFKEICGAGVVLKLLCMLEDEEFVMEQYADLAALGTIGDVVPLRGENRYIVRRGLESIRNGQNIGLQRLIRSTGRTPEYLTATDIAFYICPRINTAGRMSGTAGNAGAVKAARLLLTDSPDTAARFAEELELLNNERKAAESAIMAEIDQMLSEHPELLYQRVLVVCGRGWRHGVLSTLAPKLIDRYGKPVFLLSAEDGLVRGSARSIDGFSIHRALTACSDVLTAFGGHPKAGGFSLEESRVEEFKSRLYEYAKKNYAAMPEHSLFADMETDFASLTKENLELMKNLEPFGEGNRQPAFLLRNCVLRSKRALKNGQFTAVEVESGGKVLKAVSFKLPFARFYPEVGSRIDLIANAELNEYNGNTNVELKMIDFRPSGFAEDRFFAAQRVYEALRRGEGCDPRLAPRVIPQDRAALMQIYDLVKRDGARLSAEEMCLSGCGINYCMLRITLDAFAEAGMISLSADAQRAEVIPVREKRDLFAQGLLAELNKGFQRA